MAHRREVQLGFAQEDMIEVIGDVSPQATVVVRGGERLRDGQLVKWEKQQAPATDGIVSEAM